MTEGEIALLKNPDYRAKLVRERFIFTPRKKSASAEETFTSVANRLNFTCYDQTGEKKEDFIVRAQNIHTCLQIGARIAQHWHQYGNLNTTGKNAFIWEDVYFQIVDGYERRWNPDCWACVYKNGRVVFKSETPQNNGFLDIIEQVFAHEKCDYRHIPWIAQRLFNEAGREINIEYDCDIAMELFGNGSSVKNHLVHRDVENRTELQVDVMQRSSRYVRGAKGKKVQIHECMHVSGLIFEALQLGFVIGRNNYESKQGLIKTGQRKNIESDYALKRISKISQLLDEYKNEHNLVFKPRPDFYQNIKNVERSFSMKKELA